MAVVCLGLFLSGCTPQLQVAPNPDTHRVLSSLDKRRPRQIELYFDGTSNNWLARTNVRRRFEMGAWMEDPARPCCYIEGVGVSSLSGRALGIGMEARVLKGYAFLAKHWRKGDKIVIFGFSRGAFEARVLTGLMAHCGLPDGASRSQPENLEKVVHQVWDFCRESLKDPVEEKGEGNSRKAANFRMKLAENQRRTAEHFGGSGFKFNSPKISFLGMWDTVAGLPITKLEEFGKVTSKPQRYKVRPYPNVAVIAHALALDETRSRFNPLLVGPPIDEAATTVYEVWFPGAHSDVGGGYADSNDMAGTSFNWVHQIMLNHNVMTRFSKVYSDACAIMHHPENNRVNAFGSHKKQRTLPLNSVVDESVFVRANKYLHPEEGHRAYVLYRPTIQVGTAESNTMVPITPARSAEDRRNVLGPHLTLNRSETNPSKPVEKTGAPLPVSAMQVPTVEAAAP